MALSLTEELELVEAAIKRTLLAQASTAADGRSRTNPSLAELYRQRAELKLRIDLATNGRVRALEGRDAGGAFQLAAEAGVRRGSADAGGFAEAGVFAEGVSVRL